MTAAQFTATASGFSSRSMWCSVLLGASVHSDGFWLLFQVDVVSVLLGALFVCVVFMVVAFASA